MIDDIQVLKDKITNNFLPDALRENSEIILRRLDRMSKFKSYSSDYEIASKYIDTITQIPWDKKTEDNLDINNAKMIMDKNHYGMDPVKERVLEYLASMNFNKQQPAPILCFVGLQGIGKTTIANSIAEALNRNFVRIALGGLASVLEIRGQSKVNADAEPGYIIKALIRAKSMNPVILLDEFDKISDEGSVRSSVMATFLEILDPEQNTAFLDHYIDYPVNLSNVMFILTANNLSTLSSALLDRIEIIRFSSYSDEEKLKIAKDFILPKLYTRLGLNSSQIKFDDDVWNDMIRPLGYEAGIRELERVLMNIGRRVSKKILMDKVDSVQITKSNLKEYLPIGY
jgi:ATP-dependent Lon protease